MLLLGLKVILRGCCWLLGGASAVMGQKRSFRRAVFDVGACSLRLWRLRRRAVEKLYPKIHPLDLLLISRDGSMY